MAGKVAGVDVLLKVKSGASYITVGGQKGASLKRQAKAIDVTDKNSGGWADAISGVLSWKLDCDGFIVLGDTGLEALMTSFTNREKIEVEIRIGDDSDATGYTYTGAGYITDFPEEFNADSAVSFKLGIDGSGALTRTLGVHP